MSGPAGMSADIVDRLCNATTTILKDTDARQRFTAIGLEITLMSVKEFNDFIVAEMAKCTKVVKDSGAKVE